MQEDRLGVGGFLRFGFQRINLDLLGALEDLQGFPGELVGAGFWLFAFLDAESREQGQESQ
jgi:hypothetical protein